MPGAVLVINAGSSSIKFALYEVAADGGLERLSHGLLDQGDEARLTIRSADGRRLADRRLAGKRSPEDDFGELLDWMDRESGADDLIGVGHRVVRRRLGFAGLTFHAELAISSQRCRAIQQAIAVKLRHLAVADLIKHLDFGLARRVAWP